MIERKKCINCLLPEYKVEHDLIQGRLYRKVFIFSVVRTRSC